MKHFTLLLLISSTLLISACSTKVDCRQVNRFSRLSRAELRCLDPFSQANYLCHREGDQAACATVYRRLDAGRAAAAMSEAYGAASEAQHQDNMRYLNQQIRINEDRLIDHGNRTVQRGYGLSR